ncbi:MAG: TonB-dependent receptor plug domain-containing protein [Candidatus Tenebribacter mawsonii]|nr:TonB-dependent receptor plug domain-containing protein [Candidatus Tenebribacter mawsonii]
MDFRLRIILIVLLGVYSLNFYGQGSVEGTITDSFTGETLIGVNVVYASGKGVISDFEGKYKIDFGNGSYTLTISYVGYISQTINIIINNNSVIVDAALKTVTLGEVEVVGDLAQSRETPVAFSTITPVQIQEELAAQEIPMILNSTPGVYATQQGGGDGDARINIRGFSQRNVAVMIDGLPVNDMENGWVYWSNWFGLDAVTQTIQVQRGLGASKLALPSVGGTMNIITAGISQERKIKIKQDVGDNGYLRSSIGYTSGQLKGGWGVTAAGSYKRGKGWVDRTFTEGWFYYLKVDKKIGKHIISFTTMGAPQEHGQRKYKKPIATYDSVYAAKLGVDTAAAAYFASSLDPTSMVNKGLRYNADWGSYTDLNGENHVLNDKINYYFKPLFTLRHFWSPNDKFYLSNILYLSLGKGGGTAMKKTVMPKYITDEGQVDMQAYYDKNLNFVDTNFSDKPQSYQFVRSNNNNHNWIGFLSTFNYSITNEFTFSGGIDLRRYVGVHYEEVYNLLGGTYLFDKRNSNRDPNMMLHEGDKINYHNDAQIYWGGIFTQLEYKTGNFSAFINLTAATTGFKKIDYFLPRELKLSDTTLTIGYGSSIEYNGQVYNDETPGLTWQQSDWKWIPGYTFKGGVNYNLSEKSNAFLNLGYMSKAPAFTNVYEKYNVNLLRDIRNEYIKAIELGYSFQNRLFTVNTNAYYTAWENKPGRQVSVPLEDGQTGYFNIQGMDALHMGVELDFIVRILDNLKVDGLMSIGDWKWNSADSVKLYDDNNSFVKTQYFNAKGVHVGDAAQTQLGMGIRYEPIKRLYISARATYFDNYYADFNPLFLNPDEFPNSFDENGNPIDSWEIPSYFMVGFNAGYTMYFKEFRFDLRGSVLNALNELYISDAMNNDTYSSKVLTGDAMSAGVFMGLGRRFNVSLAITLP